MNVSLTPELEKYIQKQVASERYQTASEVVRHAIRLMQDGEGYERARLEALRRDLAHGFEQVDRGEYAEGKDLSVERIRNLAIKKFGRPRGVKRSRK